MRPLILIIALTTLPGCGRKAPDFKLSLDDVLSREANRRGSIFAHMGDAGPYREESGSVGGKQFAGHFEAGREHNRIKIPFPATDGYFYEATSYVNADGGAYLVVRKVPVS